MGRFEGCATDAANAPSWSSAAARRPAQVPRPVPGHSMRDTKRVPPTSKATLPAPCRLPQSMTKRGLGACAVAGVIARPAQHTAAASTLRALMVALRVVARQLLARNTRSGASQAIRSVSAGRDAGRREPVRDATNGCTSPLHAPPAGLERWGQGSTWARARARRDRTAASWSRDPRHHEKRP